MLPQVQAPFAFTKALVPYKRVLGILVRQTCVSLAVSNPYLSLAEPVGAVLLRDGRVPTRVLLKMLAPYGGDVTGVMYGCETVPSQEEALRDRHVTSVLKDIQGVLHQVQSSGPAPADPYITSWWDRWDPNVPASCRVVVPAGPAAAAAGPAPSSSSGSSGTPVPGAPGATQAQGVAMGVAPGEGAGATTVAAVAGARAGSLQSVAARGPGGPGQPQPQCSMATLFLQHYLDSLGSLNTFG